MKPGFISKYFPLPKFLSPSHIGMSFSDSNIKTMSFDPRLQKPDLKSVVVPLESGVVVGGKIMNPNELVKKLSPLRKTFTSPFVFFAIPDELTYLFVVSIPVSGRGREGVAESVAFTIEENVPLSLADTVFDFKPIEIGKVDSEWKAEVVVAACPKKELEKYAKVLEEAGFDLVGCVHESQAVSNAVIPRGFKGQSYVIHGRKDRIGIYMVKDNVVHFSTLRSVLGGDYKEQFLDEYVKFLEYSLRYDADKKQSNKNVLVCGEFDFAKKITEAVIEKYNMVQNIKLANVWNNVLKIEKNTPDINYEESLSLAGPIGAILSDVV